MNNSLPNKAELGDTEEGGSQFFRVSGFSIVSVLG